MREVIAELIECILEVDVVLPQRVVGVEDEMLALHPAGRS
jgi:hypothetical protein